jgi:hypothetical protein
MSHCTARGESATGDALSCGQSSLSQSGPSFPSASNTRMFANLGLISAVLSLFIVPEIFGAVAIILGAYTWRKEQGNRGLYIIILGVTCMIVGIYFTSFFELGDLIPPSSSGAMIT